MKQHCTVAVDKIFLLADREEIVAQLSSFDWEFSEFAVVVLRQGLREVSMKQIGCGNHQGKATLVLAPVGGWAAAEPVLRAIAADDGQIVVETGRSPQA